MSAKKTLRVLLIDDDLYCLEAMKGALAPFDDVEIAGALQDGNAAVALLQSSRIDAVFLDIEMDSVDGFSLARHIRAHYPHIQVVFQTGHTGYAVDGYEYQPADFLVKPINVMKVERALAHIRERMGAVPEPPSHSSRAQIGLRSGAGLTIINVDEVLYIEKSGRRVYIICRNRERIATSYSLQNLQSIFAEYDFIRCHQSFLVPLSKIRHIQADELNRRSYTIRLEGTDQSIPLSRDRFEALESILTKQGIAIY